MHTGKNVRSLNVRMPLTALHPVLPIHQLAALGYGILFLLVFGESLAFVGFFVPGSTVVLVAGSLAARGVYNIWLLILVCSLAAVLGNTVSFGLGLSGRSWFQRSPRLREYLKDGEHFFKLFGGISVFLSHFLGPVRHVIPFVAGTARMPRRAFEATNIPGAVVWAVTHLGIGFFLGDVWRSRIPFADRILIVGGISLLFIALTLLVARWIRERRTRSSGREGSAAGREQ